MLPLLSLFLLSLHTPSDLLKNKITARAYISENTKSQIGKYFICDNIDGIICTNYKADSFIDFLAYLIIIDVEYSVSEDGYFIFKKKEAK